MTDPNQDLADRLQQLAEDTVDRLNADARDAVGTPAVLTSYVLIVEGNGLDDDGQPVTRGMVASQGSSSQVKGLLADTLDDLRYRG